MVATHSIFRTLAAALLLAGVALPSPAQDAPPKPEPPRPEKSDKPDSRPDRGDRPPDKRDGDHDPRDPRRSFGPGGPRGPRMFEVLTPDELKEVVAAVEVRNPELAKKVREQFSDLFRRPAPLTDDQVKKAIVIFEERMPELADRLKEGLKSNPDRIKAVIGAQWYKLYKVIELRETDRKMYDAQTEEIRRGGEVRQLAHKLRKATDDKDENQIKALREELRSRLRAQHEAQRRLQNLEIARLDERIARIRGEITEDDKKIDQRIDEQIKRLLTSPLGPGPGSPANDRPEIVNP